MASPSTFDVVCAILADSTPRPRMRDLAAVGQRYRHKITGRTVQVTQVYRTDREVQTMGVLSARWVPFTGSRETISFDRLRDEFELLVDLERAR